MERTLRFFLDIGGWGRFYGPMKNTFNRINPALETLLPSVSMLARQAGAIIMGFHGRKYQVEIKDDESPVTAADKKSSAFLVSGLSRLTPGYAVISEENTITPDGTSAAPFWVIDPLDGTKEFIDQTGGFCVKIALIDAARPVLGVIYCPAQDVLYTGLEHGQPLKTKGSQAPEILKTRFASEKGALTTLFNRKHADPVLYREYRLAMAAQGVTIPVQPKIKPGLPRSLQVAEGLVDAHVGSGIRAGSGYGWDVAADDLILTLAGGSLFSLTDGRALNYANPRDMVPPYLAVGDASLRTKLFPAPKNN